MHRFRILIISATLTLSLFAVGLFALSANAVVPEGDTGNWMVSIDSIVPTDSSAVVHGTVYSGINTAGANISITTRHITSASATQVQNGSQTHGVTDSSGKFSITIDTLIPATSYNVNATATAPQGTLATSTQETFTTNQGGDLGSDVHIIYNGQPVATQNTLTLKFKATGLPSQTSATIQLKRNGTTIKTNTVAQIIPDASGVATFQTTFSGLTTATAYTGQITLGDGSVVGFGPDSTANANGTPPTQSPIHVYISENDAVVTSTTFSITGFVTGDSTTATSIKGFASTDGINYGISSPVAYTGAPDTVGSVFTVSFSGLSAGKSYSYKIKDTTTDKDLSPVYYFTTASSSGGVGSTGIDGTWFDLNANYQSANPQKNGCTETKDGEYCMLAPIPFPGIINGKLGLTPDTTGSSGVSNFINGIIQFAIAFAGLLAVIMIIAGGIMYATTEAMSGKAGAKTMITNAIFGLLLALCSYLILKTISPSLVDVKLDIARHSVTVSSNDTSTGSSTSLCISPTNPPNPDTAQAVMPILSTALTNEYIPERDKLTGVPKGKKLLMTAQTAVEGFSGTTTAMGIKTGTLSYRTNNPGNIGNTDDGSTKTYPTLAAGVNAQLTKVISGSGSYIIDGVYDCALGKGVKYDGSLYQYLRIYSTGARKDNAYLSFIIGYFKNNGKTITGHTKMSEIYTMN